MENVHLRILSWDQFHQKIHKLAKKVQDSDFEPEVIAGIGFGGIIPATTLYFAIPEVKFRILYPDKYGNLETENIKELENRRVLLVDDLVISGDSLSATRTKILESGATDIRTACVYCTPGYEELDFCHRMLEPDERIVFPWYTCPDDKGVKVFKYVGRFGKYEPNI